MASRSSEKDCELRRGFMVPLLVFLVVPECQRFTLDPVAATKSLEKQLQFRSDLILKIYPVLVITPYSQIILNYIAKYKKVIR